jgi:hypothetical protein
MHRPGIARVIGDRIILDGTTIEEVQRYHLDTLKLAVSEANRLLEEDKVTTKRQSERISLKKVQHREHIAEIARKLKFED